MSKPVSEWQSQLFNFDAATFFDFQASARHYPFFNKDAINLDQIRFISFRASNALVCFKANPMWPNGADVAIKKESARDLEKAWSAWLAENPEQSK